MKSCLSFDFLTPNVDQQHTTRLWIQTILQIQLPPDSDNLYKTLRDGIFLCNLMNNLISNSIPFIYYENNIHAWTQNIQQFLIAAEQKGGLDTFQLFDINDLLYGKDMIMVARTLSFLHDRITKKNQLDQLLLQKKCTSSSPALNYQQQQHHHHRPNSNVRIMKRRYTIPFGQEEECLATDSDNRRSHLGVLHDIGEHEEEKEKLGTLSSLPTISSSSASLVLTNTKEIKEKKEQLSQHQQQRQRKRPISLSTKIRELSIPFENSNSNNLNKDDDNSIPNTPSDRHSPGIDSTYSGDSGYDTSSTTLVKDKNTLSKNPIHLTSLFNPPTHPPFQEQPTMLDSNRINTLGRHERLSTIDFYNNNNNTTNDDNKATLDDDDNRMDKYSNKSKTTGRNSTTSRLARLSSNLSFKKRLHLGSNNINHNNDTRQKIPFHMRYQEWTDLKLAKRRPSLDSISMDHTNRIPPSTGQYQKEQEKTRIEASLSSPIYNSSHYYSLREQEYLDQQMNKSSWTDTLKSQEIGTTTRCDSWMKNTPITKKNDTRRKLSETLKSNPRCTNNSVLTTTATTSTSTSCSSSTTDNTGERLEMYHLDGSIVARYKLGNTIGKGQFGTVHRALNLNTGQMVAIKRIKLDPSKIDAIEDVMQEAQILRTLSHPNIVKYEGFIQTTNHCMNIVLEYVENGSLASTLKSFGSFPENLVASYCLRILKGLAYLHQQDVVHCDLKAANILTTKNGDVKLSDFGVSINLKLKESFTDSVAGTPNWMAPEVIELQGASTKSDIWSLGCTLIELYTGKPPYADLIPMATLFRIVEDDCPPIPKNGSKEFKDFLKQCFHKIPKNRPTALELLDHPWIQQYTTFSSPLSTKSTPSSFHNDTTTHKSSPIPTLDIHFYDNDNKSTSSILYPGDVAEHYKQTPSIEHYHESNIQHQHQRTSILVNKLHERQEKLNPSSVNIIREHCFIKGSFPKGAIRCKTCQLPIRRNALVCEDCGFICHDKCKPTTGSCRSNLTDNISIRSGSESSCSSSLIESTHSTISTKTTSPRPTSSMSSHLRERTRKLSRVLTHHRRPQSTKSHDTLRFIREDDNGEILQPAQVSSISTNNTNDINTPNNLNDDPTLIRNNNSTSDTEIPSRSKGTRRKKIHRSSNTSSEDCIIS